MNKKLRASNAEFAVRELIVRQDIRVCVIFLAVFVVAVAGFYSLEAFLGR